MSHANHWAQTPAIAQATSADDFATVQLAGTASALSVVDVFLDTQVDVVHLGSATVAADGSFSYSGPLPGQGGQVFVASTLNDPAKPQRAGSSSQLSGAVSIQQVTGEPLLAATGQVVNISFPGSASASAGDVIRFTASITNVGGVAVTAIGGSGLSVPGTATVIPASGRAVGGAGFAATDSGFSGGTLQPGQHASYTLDLRVAPQAVSGSIVVRMDVTGSAIVTIPVVGRIPIVARASVPRVFAPFAQS